MLIIETITRDRVTSARSRLPTRPRYQQVQQAMSSIGYTSARHS